MEVAPQPGLFNGQYSGNHMHFLDRQGITIPWDSQALPEMAGSQQVKDPTGTVIESY